MIQLAVALVVLFALPMLFFATVGLVLLFPGPLREQVVFYLAKRGILWAEMGDNVFLARKKGNTIIKGFFRFSDAAMIPGIAEAIIDMVLAGIDYEIIVADEENELVNMLEREIASQWQTRQSTTSDEESIDATEVLAEDVALDRNKVNGGNNTAVWIGFKPTYSVASYSWTAQLEYGAQEIKHGVYMGDQDFLFPKEPPSAETLLADKKSKDKADDKKKSEGEESKSKELPISSIEWLRQEVKKAKETRTPMDPDDVRKLSFINNLQTASGSQVSLSAQLFYRIQNAFRFDVNGKYWMDKIRGDVNNGLLQASAGIPLVEFEEHDFDSAQGDKKVVKAKAMKAALGKYGQTLQRRLNILFGIMVKVDANDADTKAVADVLPAERPRQYYRRVAGLEIREVKLQDFEPASTELRAKLQEQDAAHVDANKAVVIAQGQRDSETLLGQGAHNRRVSEITAISSQSDEAVERDLRYRAIEAMNNNNRDLGNRIILQNGSGGSSNDIGQAMHMAAGMLAVRDKLDSPQSSKERKSEEAATPTPTPGDKQKSPRKGKSDRRGNRPNRQGGAGHEPTPPPEKK